MVRQSTPCVWRKSVSGKSVRRPWGRRVRAWGVATVDVPVAAAEVCAAAYHRYRERRRRQSGKDSPRVPLPDFFIGAHAQIMAWPLATADTGRIKTYFPSVRLLVP